ncbi:MAG: recombinase family protein, partial [Anaerolineae bacterium]|nr:recombinase family protein [Anaerolineae bacterium]
VRKIFELCDSGLSLHRIRKQLIAMEAEQKTGTTKHKWEVGNLSQILRAEDYTGIATWKFQVDAEPMSIEIPAIVERDLWQRCVDRLKSNRTRRSTRNAKGVYLLQNVLHCAECQSRMLSRGTPYYWVTSKDGTRKKRMRKIPHHSYACVSSVAYPDELHPKPAQFNGHRLDWEVWRYIVDNGIKRPETITAQITNKQAELQAQGDSIDGDITHAKEKLFEIDQERLGYQQQMARRKIREDEFDAHMDRTQANREYWQSEIERLKELRDDAEKVQRGIDYVYSFLTGLQKDLERIDIEPEALVELPQEKRDKILKERRKVILALCDRIFIDHNGHVEILGLFDGGESAQFTYDTPASRTRS